MYQRRTLETISQHMNDISSKYIKEKKTKENRGKRKTNKQTRKGGRVEQTQGPASTAKQKCGHGREIKSNQ
jgi:hypothetical protein